MASGAVLGSRYRLLERIGEGGMGDVYEAEDAASGGRVAVKLIRADRDGLSEAVVRRFQREARAAMAVASEHIARVLDAGFDEGARAPYLVMELLRGEDLDAVLRRLGPLPPACALRVVGQACAGLAAAHGAGIVHRDIKPANLFLARGEGGGGGGRITVKLLDFGIAKVLAGPEGGVGSGSLTSTGMMLGSALYMSPEQAQGLRGIDHRSDIWSLGVVLYAALTGREPHANAGFLGDIILAICERPPTPVREAAPWVGAEVAAIVHDALRLEPEERMQSAGEMLGRIRGVLGGGLELGEEMLVPVDAAERGRVAPRG